MAFAGAATRDLLVTRIPLALQSPIEIRLGLVGVGLALALARVLTSPETHPLTLLAGAIGFAAFTTTGAIVAAEADVSAFDIISIAMTNGVGGGAFADSCWTERSSASLRISMQVVPFSVGSRSCWWNRSKLQKAWLLKWVPE